MRGPTSPYITAAPTAAARSMSCSARRSDAADACPDDRSRPSAPVVVTMLTPCRRPAATTASAPDARALAPVSDALAAPRPAMASIASVAESSGKHSPLTDTRGCTGFAPFLPVGASPSPDADGPLAEPGRFRLHPRHRLLHRPAELHRPLEQQPGDAGLFVAGERVEPAEFGHGPAERILVGPDDLAARRGTRDRPRRDGGVAGVVGEEGQPGQVDARVAHRPDLPVDDRVDPVAFAQGVAEP